MTSIDSNVFKNCTGLASVIIGSSVKSISGNAFNGSKLRNVLIKCITPPTASATSFSEQTFNYSPLYIPIGSLNPYAYDDVWYKFKTIREIAMKEENISIWQAYTLLNVGTFAHIIYDPENDQIATIQSVSNINENNPNHCWQIIEAGGMHFLYNIGAGKYLKRNGNKLELTDTSEPIDVEDGNNGLIIGKQEAQQWALVINERMNVNISVIDEVTGIESPFREKEEDAVYDIQGRRISEPQKGINIIRMSDGKTGKVLIK